MKNTSKPPFLLHEVDETPGKWFYLAAAVALLAVLGFVGRLDYMEAARQECAGKRMQYDPEGDVCFTEHKSPTRNNPKAPPQWHDRPKPLNRLRKNSPCRPTSSREWI